LKQLKLREAQFSKNRVERGFCFGGVRHEILKT